MMKNKIRKWMSGFLATAMVLTLMPFAGMKEVKADSATQNLYTGFREITDVSEFVVGQTYMFTEDQYNGKDGFSSIPDGGAELKIVKNQLDNSSDESLWESSKGVVTYEGHEYEFPYWAGRVNREVVQATVDVVKKGEGFDGCSGGTIGYGTLENVDASYSVSPYSRTVSGTGWWYGCNGGGVYHIGPMHVYAYDTVEYSEEDITITKSANWDDTANVDANGNKVVTKDDINVTVSAANGQRYNIAFYEILSSDNTFNLANEDNKITVKIGDITKQIEIAQPQKGSLDKIDNDFENKTGASDLDIGIVTGINDVVGALEGTVQEKIEKALADGNNVSINLNVKQLEAEDLAEGAAEAIDAARGDFEIGQYVDISLFMHVFNGVGVETESEKLAELPNGYIEVSIVIPEELRNTDESIEREYALIRLHEGESEATVLTGVYDKETYAFKFATNKFSDYAIVYKDSKAVVPTETAAEAETPVTKTAESVDTATESTTTVASADATTVARAPKTEDTSYMMVKILYLVMILSGVGFITTIIEKKRVRK
ncbi:hypothetical protein SAMN02910453_1246 [Lachnospiraceae bacterium A10]|nr:hypothetical protein SAMN02910453_1246 [Lachnospiraceae bacterium A10]